MSVRQYLIREESDGTFAVAKPTTWAVDVLATSLSFDEAVEFLTSLGAPSSVAKVLEAKHGVATVFCYDEEVAR